MKHIYIQTAFRFTQQLKKILLCSFTILLLMSIVVKVSAQCLTATNGQYPTTNFTPGTCNGVPQSITTTGYAGEYSKVVLTAGVAYTFSSSVSTDYITISNNGGGTALAFGITPVTYTPPAGATVRFYTHTNSACGEATVSRTRSVNCGTAPTPTCNTLLTPANAATGVSTQPTPLTFNAATNAASYDVYLGITNTPPLLGNITATSITVSGLLSGTTYFWYTVPKNAAGSAPTGCISNIRSFTTAVGPVNDECVTATTLAMNAAAISGTTVNADQSLAALACSGSTSTFAYDVWYKFSAISTSQTITVVGGTGFDGVVQGFSGTCGALVSLGCVDVTGAAGTETLSLSGLTVCSTYYLRVYGYGTTGTPTGTFTIKVAGTSTLTVPTSAAATPNPVCNDGVAGNISLTATGGAGGTITWYTGSCGGSLVGTGSPLVIAKPLTTTTYFARRETSCGNDVTACVSTVVTVNQRSGNPTSATASLTTICNGTASTLTLTGGGGGTGEVIKWYTASCGGTLAGTGNGLSVSPATTTTYFGRYEDGAPCNYNSSCAAVTITVSQKSANPTSATATANTICNGDATTLTLNGGGGGTGEVIKWYTGSCGGTLAGTGNGLSVNPATTTTYFGRYEDGAPCNYNSLCSSVTVTVNQKSANPTSASAAATTICNGSSTTLTLNGGGGGTGEVIKWYTGSCGGTVAGSGNGLSVSPATTTTYFGRYEDGAPCNYNSLCASVTITVNSNYEITASANANGTISPNGISTLSCFGTGSQTYTITPNACYRISDVMVDAVSQGPVGTYTFTNVTANHTITASFVLNTYTITATAGANGTINPGTGVVNCGNNATYTITPNACYSIADVIVDGVSQGAVGTYTFTNITANHNISATFTLNTYSITVTSGANGTITPGTGSVNCGANATYTITPNACYSIADVIVDGVSQGAVGTFTFTNVTTNHNISASFTLNTYSITVTAGANGTITPGTGTVNCGANATYNITPAACYSVSDVLVDGVSVGAVAQYTFTNVTANHTISASFVFNTYSITVTAGANGTITPATGTVNCGDNATYTITPNACYSIADVVVDGVSQGAVGTYTFTNVTANHNISATFTLNTYSITATAGANGTITPATGTVNCGDNATYTITPNACYSIADVIVDGVSQGAVGTYTFTNVTANHNISASFTLNTYSITVTAGANGTITPATGNVNCGDNATYTITPNACYSIADVIVDGVSQGAVGTYTFTNVTANHNISASFVFNTYSITVTAGANGTITPATGTVNCGDNATYTITPNACYSIADVIVDGVSQGTVGTYTFTNVTANHNISATFTLNTYSITVTAGANGTITPATGTVNCGDNATYTITPNACYSIADVIVDGVSQGAVGTYTFTNVTANHNISASFTLNTYTITATAGSNGTITPGTGSVNCGDNATYTITPNACYSIADVIVDGVSQGAVATYTFTNVTANHNISASFVLNTYTISVTAGANGTITPATGTVNCGANATYTITPNACYSIADVIVDGVSQGAVGTYTFTNVTANHNITASFTLNTYSITVTAGANGTITPATGNVNCGDNATYTITPNSCYSIADVIVDGVSQGAVGTYTFTNVTANHNISASFTLNTYSITVTAGANGTITPATGNVNCGDNATYTITPNACYSIADVIADGVSQGAVGTYTFTNVTANHNISATFVLNTYNITATAGANGTITPATGTVNCGDNATYTITPNACYSIADVVVDGQSQGAVGTYTFTNVTASHNISASFVLNTYTISVTAGANGTITPGTGSVNCGDNATYTITPNACYSIADVIVDGVSQGAVGTYTFTNVTANHNISASFTLNTYSITVAAGANGTITPGTGTVNCGDNATYTITPNACYSIADVIVDGVSQGAVGTYTFTNVTANHNISATFVLNTYNITATAGANGTITPATGTVNCGDNATYTITPNACYSIADVIVDGVSQGAVGTYTFTNVTANHNISASFTLNTYSITVTAGANGTITPGTGTITCGGNATYTITPNACYSIANVIVDGVSQGAIGTYTFSNATTNHTISASFVAITYTITVSSGANGSITPGTGSVNCGNNATYTITPASCYHINDVIVDGISQGTIGTYTFSNVTATHTISASFTANVALTAPVVSGIVNVCPYIGTGTQLTYTSQAVPGATSYNWVVPTSVTIVSGQGTASINVIINNGFQANGNKQIRLTVQTTCGVTPQTIYVLVAQSPNTPQPITGNSNVCPVIGTAATITYTIPSVVGATSYIWTAQAGTTTISHPNGAGINDTTVTVSFSNSFTSSALTVQAANGCGTSNARSLTLVRTNPSTPGLITGPTNACAYIAPGGTAAGYSIVPVSGATVYTWTVPAGAIGFTGQGTTSISFTYPAGFTTGVVTVTAGNGCGTSSARSLSISKLNPSTPSVIDVIQTAPCPDRLYSYTISSTPANSTSVQWTVPAGGTIVSGQGSNSITVSYLSASAINGNVTAQAFNNCGSSTVRVSPVRLAACAQDFTRGTVITKGTTIQTPATMQVQVYPNPTVSDFKVAVLTAGKQTINVRILDATGRSFKQFTVQPYQTTTIGADLKAGAYILEVRQGSEVKTTKLLKF